MSEQETKRSEVIFLLKNVSKCAENVAKVVKVSKRAIFRMKKKLKENKGPERVVGSGRKPILNGAARRVLGTFTYRHPQLSNPRLARKMEQARLPSVSDRTIGNCLKKLGIKRKNPSSKPQITPSHATKRIEFCQKYLNYDWSRMIFPDEATFSLYSFKRKLLCKKRKSVGKLKFPKKLMV